MQHSVCFDRAWSRILFFAMPKIIYETLSEIEKANKLARALNLPIAADSDETDKIYFYVTATDLELHYFLPKSHLKPRPQAKHAASEKYTLCVDFLSGKNQYRQKYGGGKNQLLAKAVGMKSGFIPSVLDLTAGFGSDAYVLASLGCEVTMLERSPFVAALVENGLERLFLKQPTLKNKLHFICIEAKQYLLTLEMKPDVIYIDPMYPNKERKTAAKKEMTILRFLVGDDNDAVDLLPLALAAAKKRVVVKRPRLAPQLNNHTPDVTFKGKSSRFDVYFPTLQQKIKF